MKKATEEMFQICEVSENTAGPSGSRHLKVGFVSEKKNQLKKQSKLNGNVRIILGGERHRKRRGSH